MKRINNHCGHFIAGVNRNTGKPTCCLCGMSLDSIKEVEKIELLRLKALRNAKRIRSLQKIGLAPNSSFTFWEQVANDYQSTINKLQR